MTPSSPEFAQMERDMDERAARRKEKEALAERERLEGNRLLRAGQAAAALAAYERGLAANKRSLALHANAAQAALSSKCFVAAVDHATAAQQLAEFMHEDKAHPLAVKALVRRAKARHALGHVAERARDLKQAAEAAEQLRGFDPAALQEIRRDIAAAEDALADQKTLKALKAKAAKAATNDDSDAAECAAASFGALRRVEAAVGALSSPKGAESGGDDATAAADDDGTHLDCLIDAMATSGDQAAAADARRYFGACGGTAAVLRVAKVMTRADGDQSGSAAPQHETAVKALRALALAFMEDAVIRAALADTDGGGGTADALLDVVISASSDGGGGDAGAATDVAVVGSAAEALQLLQTLPAGREAAARALGSEKRRPAAAVLAACATSAPPAAGAAAAGALAAAAAESASWAAFSGAPGAEPAAIVELLTRVAGGLMLGGVGGNGVPPGGVTSSQATGASASEALLASRAAALAGNLLRCDTVRSALLGVGQEGARRLMRLLVALASLSADCRAGALAALANATAAPEGAAALFGDAEGAGAAVRVAAAALASQAGGAGKGGKDTALGERAAALLARAGSAAPAAVASHPTAVSDLAAAAARVCEPGKGTEAAAAVRALAAMCKAGGDAARAAALGRGAVAAALAVVGHATADADARPAGGNAALLLSELASHGEGAGAGALLAADAVPPLVGLMTAAADDRGVKGANARRNAAIALARLVQADRSGEGLEQLRELRGFEKMMALVKV